MGKGRREGERQRARVMRWRVKRERWGKVECRGCGKGRGRWMCNRGGEIGLGDEMLGQAVPRPGLGVEGRSQLAPSPSPTSPPATRLAAQESRGEIFPLCTHRPPCRAVPGGPLGPNSTRQAAPRIYLSWLHPWGQPRGQPRGQPSTSPPQPSLANRKTPLRSRCAIPPEESINRLICSGPEQV